MSFDSHHSVTEHIGEVTVSWDEPGSFFSFSLLVSAPPRPHSISCLGLVQSTASVPEPCYLKKKKKENSAITMVTCILLHFNQRYKEAAREKV